MKIEVMLVLQTPEHLVLGLIHTSNLKMPILGSKSTLKPMGNEFTLLHTLEMHFVMNLNANHKSPAGWAALYIVV